MNKVLNFVRRTIAAIKSYQLTQIKLKLKFIDLSFAPSHFHHGIARLSFQKCRPMW